jgi:peptidoglycan/xylan/chitin deacetylase (PgdA/CDA1 family)
MIFSPTSWSAIAAISLLVATSPIPSARQTGLETAEMERGPLLHQQVALTFDAGGGDEGLPELLQTLETTNVRSTFFVTGKWAEEFPASAAQIVAKGHIIGNHTWGH